MNINTLKQSINQHETYSYELFELDMWKETSKELKEDFMQTVFLFSEKISAVQSYCKLEYTVKSMFAAAMLADYFNIQLEDPLNDAESVADMMHTNNIVKPVTDDIKQDNEHFDEFLRRIIMLYKKHHNELPTDIDKVWQFVYENQYASELFDTDLFN